MLLTEQFDIVVQSSSLAEYLEISQGWIPVEGYSSYETAKGTNTVLLLLYRNPEKKKKVKQKQWHGELFSENSGLVNHTSEDLSKTFIYYYNWLY